MVLAALTNDPEKNNLILVERVSCREANKWLPSVSVKVHNSLIWSISLIFAVGLHLYNAA